MPLLILPVFNQDEGSGEAFKDDQVCQAFLRGPVSQLYNTAQPSTINPRYSIFCLFLMLTVYMYTEENYCGNDRPDEWSGMT